MQHGGLNFCAVAYVYLLGICTLLVITMYAGSFTRGGERASGKVYGIVMTSLHFL